MSLFGTAGIRGPVADEVTPALALRVGRALAEDGGTFVVGRDGRETGEGLAGAIVAGLTSGGADVVRVGRVPTPALARASRGRHGVMLTASHNPPADNGIKCVADGTEYDREAEAAIEERVAADPAPAPWDEWGTVRRGEALEPYRAGVTRYVVERFGPTPLSGLSVALDAGNGMAGLAAPQVCRELGADVLALEASVDGHFPARDSKPTAASLSGFRRFVADRDVDLGMAHDGDADRIVAVGPDGEVVHEDTVLAVVAEHYVRTSDAADPVVVTTPNASARVDERVAAGGGRTERVGLGALHEGIERERAAGDDGTAVVFAAEPWKHVHPAFGGWIDGIASAGVLAALVADAGSLDALCEPVAERPYRKDGVDCPDDQKEAVMADLRERLPAEIDHESVATEYGVRLERADGSWTLVRPSGTEPVVRIYAESEDVEALVERVRAVVAAAVADATD